MGRSLAADSLLSSPHRSGGSTLGPSPHPYELRDGSVPPHLLALPPHPIPATHPPQGLHPAGGSTLPSHSMAAMAPVTSLDTRRSYSGATQLSGAPLPPTAPLPTYGMGHSHGHGLAQGHGHSGTSAAYRDVDGSRGQDQDDGFRIGGGGGHGLLPAPTRDVQGTMAGLAHLKSPERLEMDFVKGTAAILADAPGMSLKVSTSIRGGLQGN